MSSTWNQRLSLLSCLAFSSLFPLSSAKSAEPATGPALVFYAMGDVPYVHEEKALLRKQVADIPNDARFVIHVGDIKRGAPPCEPEVYREVASILSTSRHRLFVLPGDNEWNDCQDPNRSWELWAKHFMHFDRRWEQPVEGQPATRGRVVPGAGKGMIEVVRSKRRPENFAFMEGTVLVIGLNVVGGRVHDAAEWKQRHIDCLAWVKQQIAAQKHRCRALVVLAHARPAASHQDFFPGLSKAAAELKAPTLYLHGDGHVWNHDRPFAAKNILRVQVDQGGKAPPVRVSVWPGRPQAFVFDRRLPAGEN